MEVARQNVVWRTSEKRNGPASLKKKNVIPTPSPSCVSCWCLHTIHTAGEYQASFTFILVQLKTKTHSNRPLPEIALFLVDSVILLTDYSPIGVKLCYEELGLDASQF